MTRFIKAPIQTLWVFLAVLLGQTSAGRVLLGGAAIGSQGTATLGAGATLQTGTIGSEGGSALLVFDGGTLRATAIPNITVATQLGSPGGIVDTNGYSGMISGVVSGTGILTKTGSGTLLLTGDNSFSGGIHVAGGALSLGHLHAAGSGSIRLDNATYLPSVSNITNAIEVLSRGTIIAGGLTVGGPITGEASSILNIATSSSGNSNMSLGGELSGFAGTLNFSGTTGNVRINRTGSSLAAFELGNSTALIRTAFGGSVHMGSLSGGSATKLAGATNNANLTNYVVGARNTNSQFDGSISDGPFLGALTRLTKTGSGVLTITGTHTYSGETLVESGTLIVDGNTGSGVTNVLSGGRLGGTGTMSGGVNVLGEVNPGMGVGTLHANSFASFADGAMLTMELTSETSFDRLVVSGSLNIASGSTLQILSSGLQVAEGQRFDLLDWQSLSGTFSTILLPTLSSDLAFDTSELYTTGTLRITAVPEPSSVAVGIVGTSLLFLRNRRKHPTRHKDRESS